MRRICRSHGARSAAPPLQLCPPADTASASFAISSRKSSVVRSTLHSHVAGFAAKSTFPSRPGDPKKPGRVVKIEMFEGSGKVDYEPARIEVRRGEQIQFVLQNDGEEDHEFILATARENRKHAEIMKKIPKWSTTIQTENAFCRTRTARSFGSSRSAAHSSSPVSFLVTMRSI